MGQRSLRGEGLIRIFLSMAGVLFIAADVGGGGFSCRRSAPGTGSAQQGKTSPQAERIPDDWVEVADATYAPLDGLAPGSEEAQGRQREAVRQLGLPLEVKTVETGIVLRLIPPGSFTMGGEPEENDLLFAMARRHQVTLTRPFYCGKFEITQDQWKAVMGSNPSHFKNVGPDAPVEMVSWEDCQRFLERLCQMEGVPEGRYRLLTEAQWEYACRAGTTSAYYFGDTYSVLGEYAWLLHDSDRQTHLTGQKKANAFGLHDMHGNVSEWCQDWLDRSYEKGPRSDPKGPSSGGWRVLRGGSWDEGPRGSRSAHRNGAMPTFRSSEAGIRVVASWPFATKVVPAAKAVQPPGVVAGQNWIVPDLGADLGMELVYVKPGRFRMGSNTGDKDEQPVHTVQISRALWMATCEVTQSQYEALTGENPGLSDWGKGPSLPVTSVSWNDAAEFCRKLTQRERQAGRLPTGYVYRLPTEAEWEYAARGGNKSRGYEYAGSDDPAKVARYHGGGPDDVGRRHSNELGLYDMSGNVSEWCHDWYQAGYYADSPSSDPTGPSSGDGRVERGGDYMDLESGCRSADRRRLVPEGKVFSTGFRVVLAFPLLE